MCPTRLTWPALAFRGRIYTASRLTYGVRLPCFQDFVRLFQAELLMEAQLAGGGPPPPRLVDWIRGHAERSLQDKVYIRCRRYIR